MTDDQAKKETRSVEGEVRIEAPPERVWRALTAADELERWFPLEAEVEPGEGGSIYLSWGGEVAGASEILVWEPPHHLRTSWDWGGAVTDYYVEAAEGGGTHLRVVTSGFPTDASWDDWVEGTRRGWAYELRSLRHYLERHDGKDRTVVYVRRAVDLEREEIWERLTGPAGLDVRWLEGEVVDDAPPTQRALRPRALEDALLRISVEPGHGADGPSGAMEATLFLSAWGDDRGRLEGLEKEWRTVLEQLFPEGEDPAAGAAGGEGSTPIE